MSIVKMKEVTICGLLKDKHIILEKLQDLALLHIKSFSEKKSDFTDKIDSLKNDLLKIQKVESIIKPIKSIKGHVVSNVSENTWKIVDEILSLKQKRGSKIHKLSVIKNEIDKLEPWGDFDFNSIENLKKNNLKFIFSIFNHKDWKNLEKSDMVYKIVNQNEKNMWVLFILSTSL